MDVIVDFALIFSPLMIESKGKKILNLSMCTGVFCLPLPYVSSPFCSRPPISDLSMDHIILVPLCDKAFHWVQALRT